MTDSIITEWIESAVTSADVPVDRLSDEEERRLRQSVEHKFARSTEGPTLLWERLECSVARRRHDGWKDACEFADAHEVILFFDERERLGMCWRFQSGRRLRRVLEETPTVEFYVTDAAADYVLCFNHHRFLVGAGSCVPWLEDLKEDW
jgi:hypothetical protein